MNFKVGFIYLTRSAYSKIYVMDRVLDAAFE